MRTRAVGQISFHEKSKLEGKDVGKAGRPVSKLLSEKMREVTREQRGQGVGLGRVPGTTAKISKGTHSLGDIIKYFPTYLFK